MEDNGSFLLHDLKGTMYDASFYVLEIRQRPFPGRTDRADPRGRHRAADCISREPQE